MPRIRASVTLLPDLQRGRNNSKRGYRPLLVIGPTTQRVAKKEGNRLSELHHAIIICDDGITIEPGQTVELTIALSNYREPDCRYEEFVPEATFTVREGAKIVGYGTVLSRS